MLFSDSDMFVVVLMSCLNTVDDFFDFESGGLHQCM